MFRRSQDLLLYGGMIHYYKRMEDNTWLHVNYSHPLINRLKELPDENDFEITESEFEQALDSVMNRLFDTNLVIL